MDGYSHGAQGLLALRDPGHDAALPARGSSPAGVDEGPGPEAAVVLAQVRWLLQDAAERVRLCAQAEGLLSSGHPLALGAELAACEASNLMPAAPVDWYGPEQLPAEALDSLLAAEALTRSLPIEAFPAGMSGLVVQVCDLVREATALLHPDGTSPNGDSRDAG